MKFSIIVPTYNEENDITETLESLVALDYPNYEVFIVDDSTDSTPEIVRRYASRGIQLIKPGGGGRCEARNIGIGLATGEVLVILNADVHLSPDFLQRIKKHYEEGADLVGVFSKISNDDRLFARYVDTVALLQQSDIKKYGILWTEGFSCRRELAIKAGLFPGGFPVAMYAGEDGYFSENLLKAGGKSIFDPTIVVHHVAPADFKEYWYFRTTRGRACSQYRRYIDRWSMLKITGWNTLRTGFNSVKLLSVIYPLFVCWKLTSYSKKGKKDWLPLCYAHFLETVAITYGFWKELFVIYGKEKQKLNASKKYM